MPPILVLLRLTALQNNYRKCSKKKILDGSNHQLTGWKFLVSGL